MSVSPYLIAEAGIAHFGVFNDALNLLIAAKKARCDAFKLQVFDPDLLYGTSTSPWKERIKGRRLKQDEIIQISKLCQQYGIDFILTMHDTSHLNLVSRLDLSAIKIGSGECGNLPFIRDICAIGLPVIYSTGLSTREDILNVVDIADDSNVELSILLCNTAYPTPSHDANLTRLTALKNMLPHHKIGYSDHTRTHHACLAAVALGAVLIERHITLRKNIPNAQDWKVSSTPQELILLRRDINHVASLRGTPDLTVSLSAERNRSWAAKSPYLARPVYQGHTLTACDILMRRPFTGVTYQDIEPMIDSYSFTNDLVIDHPIHPSMLKYV